MVEAPRLLEDPLAQDGAQDGWVTRVEVVLSQGRNHQVRRLCKQAGLHLHHLRRLEVGPVGLGGLEPGQVRELERDEKRALYEWCLPRLLEAQQGFDESLLSVEGAEAVHGARLKRG